MNSASVMKSKVVNVDIPIDDILTQRTCAGIFIEIIKTIVYQKLQTPSTYNRLKYLIEKKREKDRLQPGHNEIWQSKNYFRLVSTAVDVLDDVFRNIIEELESKEPPVELCLLLGATPATAKEAYRLVVPPNLHVHSHRNHAMDSNRVIMNVMRNFITCQDLHAIIYQPLVPTNIYILLRRRRAPEYISSLNGAVSKFFLPVDCLRISPKIPQAVIKLDYRLNPTKNCCSNLSIYDDFTYKEDLRLTSHLDCDSDGVGLVESDTVVALSDCVNSDIWFQATAALKGFKDCFINGQCVSDLWIKRD